MALPPGYLFLLEAADALGVELDKEQAIAIENHLKARNCEIVASWQIDESKRHVGLPPVVEAGEVVSEVMGFDMGSGQSTPGCNCGHGGLGPGWHLSMCPWPARAWADKARELAKRLDEVRSARP